MGADRVAGDAAPFAVERRALCLADLEPEQIRALIAELNGRSDVLGCAVFRPPGEHNCVAVIFAGNLERFFMVAAARHLRCPVVIVQDPVSFWYQGSLLVPELDQLCRTFIAEEVGGARALLFGQSSGAYAALAAAALLPGSTVVACAPQTRSDAALKDRIRFMGVRALRTPDGLLDVRERLLAHPDPDGVRAAVIAAGELDNPATAHWWGDYLHLLPLVDVPGVDPYVVHANTHVLAHGRVNEFAVLLARLADLAHEPPELRRAAIFNFFAQAFGAPIP